MKFTIGEIKRNAYQGPHPFQKEVHVDELESMNNDIRRIGPLHVEGIYSIHKDEIIFSFTIDGEMILPCAWTLVDVPYPFHISADEVFSLSPYYGEEEVENDVHQVEGEVIDLKPYIRENVVLNIPFRVFTDDDEAYRQAAFEGEGWEFISEEKREETIDPRLEKLQSFFSDDEDKK